MRPSTLCPKMDDGLEIYGLEVYGLETLANLTESVEVARLAPEMGRAVAAVVDHMSFAACQLAIALSRPGQAAAGGTDAASQLFHCVKVRTVRTCSPIRSDTWLSISSIFLRKPAEFKSCSSCLCAGYEMRQSVCIKGCMLGQVDLLRMQF